MNTASPLLIAALLVTPGIAANAASFSKQVPVGMADRVVISNVSGSVTVTTWERREVEVQADLEDGVERVSVDQDRGGVEIKVIVRRGAWRDSAAHLRLRVPADVRVEATSVSASVSISGVQGRTFLRSVSGAIRSDRQGNDLEATSVSGRVDITGGSTRSRIRASSVSGAVTVSQGAGDLEARSTSGRLDIDLVDADHVHLSTVSGAITLRGAIDSQASVEVSSVSGRLQIATRGAGFRYEASSYSGRVSSCFEGNSQWSSRQRGSRIGGVHGAGGGLVVAKSHSGSVEICDH
jgi:DUF4097 and DUF4098 domain-containing protein YvlB